MIEIKMSGLCEECLYRKICSWEKQGAKFCSFAKRREVTT